MKNIIISIVSVAILSLMTGCSTKMLNMQDQIEIDTECKNLNLDKSVEIRYYTFSDKGIGVASNPWSLTSAKIYNKNPRIIDDVLMLDKMEAGVFTSIVMHTSLLTVGSTLNGYNDEKKIYLNGKDNTVILNKVKYSCDKKIKEAVEISKERLKKK